MHQRFNLVCELYLCLTDLCNAELKSPITGLCLLLGQLHVVKDPEDYPEQVLPPVLLEGVSVGLHDLKHHCQAPVHQT